VQIVADALVRETQKLYGLPASEFTAARNARAKKLKPDDPDLAAAVAALPKPSVAAAAVNALVREDPSEVRALIQSGKRLRRAQEAAVAGKRGADLSAAIEEHRTALERVQRDLRRFKLSGPTLEKATQTVRVTSLDPELQPLLESGTLHEDLAAAGFGLDPGIVPVRRAAPAASRPPGPTRQEREAKRRAAREELAAARSRLTAAKRAASEAERLAAAARRAVEEAAAEVERARQAAAET
jgi:hypothetical protein